MELKLAYRFLREFSSWVVHGYYDEIQVIGGENVPPSGAVIIASTHHNEIIDIATLSISMPYIRAVRDRRHLSFWAKSSMFRNPLVGLVLRSSGAISVRRNPNTAGANGSSGNSPLPATPSAPEPESSALFASTSAALFYGSRLGGEVVGIFPEGTSYTQPSIVQVLSGCSWAAIEYDKWLRKREKSQTSNSEEEAAIVPVSIVYTNKAKYLSRVRVEFGRPVRISDLPEDVRGPDGETTPANERQVVKELTTEIERRLLALSINAPDWETYYAAQIARSILWPNEDQISLQDWVAVGQKLIALFHSDAVINDEALHNAKESARKSLLTYFALLHHSGIEHSSLQLLKSHSTRSLSTIRKTFSCIPSAAKFLLCLPSVIPYIPAFLVSQFAVRFLATPGEEEGVAQFAAVGGGVGLGIGLGVTFGWANKVLSLVGRCEPLRGVNSYRPSFLRNITRRYDVLQDISTLVADASINLWNWVANSIIKTRLHMPSSLSGFIGFLLFSWLVIKCHGLQAKRAHRFLKMVNTQAILLRFQRQSGKNIREEDIQIFTQLPPPPTNEFIRRRQKREHGESIPSSRDSRPLVVTRQFRADIITYMMMKRAELIDPLGRYLKLVETRDKELIEWFRVRGAKIGSVGQ